MKKQIITRLGQRGSNVIRFALFLIVSGASLTVFADDLRQERTYQELRQMIAESPKVKSLLDDPRKNVNGNMSQLELLGIFPDLHVVDGQAVPVLSAYIACRVKFGDTGYELARAIIRPTFVDGRPQLRLVATELSDLRIDGNPLGEFGIKLFDELKAKLESDVAPKLAEAASEGLEKINSRIGDAKGLLTEIRLKSESVVLIHSLERPRPAAKVTYEYDTQALNHAKIPDAMGKPEDSALRVELWADHLLWYRFVHLYGNGHGPHGKIEGWLRERESRPGRHWVTLFLKNGDSFDDLRKVIGDWHDNIVVMRVRPGPKYTGESLTLWDTENFRGVLKPFGVGDYCLRTKKMDNFGNKADSLRVERK